MNDRLEFADCPKKLKSMWIGFLILAFLLFAFVMSVEISRAHHPAAPIAKVLGLKSVAKAFHVGGSAAGGLAVVFVGGTAVATIWCGLNQPKRNWRRDTWVDGRADAIPSYKPRRDGCLFKKRHRNIVSIRG